MFVRYATSVKYAPLKRSGLPKTTSIFCRFTHHPIQRNSLDPWTSQTPSHVSAEQAVLKGQPTDYKGMYTVLNPAYFETSRLQLKQEYTALKTPETSWITLVTLPTIERIALHESLVGTSLYVKHKSDADFILHNSLLHKKSLAALREQQHEFKKLDNKAETLSRQYQHLQPVLTLIKNNIRAGYYQPSSDIDLKKLATSITQNNLKRAYRTAQMRTIISKIILKEIASGTFAPVKTTTADNAYTVVIAGGSATGKSSITNNLLSCYTRAHNIDPYDFCSLSVDRNRLALLNDPSLGSDSTIHGTLTHSEAAYITSLQIKHRAEMATQGRAVHIYMEQFFLHENEMNILTTGGQKIRMHITDCHPKNALKNNLYRYLTTKERLPPHEVVLAGQKNVSSKTPVFIKNHIGENIVIKIHNTNNLNNSHTPIAIMNLKTNRLFIININAFIEFINKTEINPNAVNQHTLFSAPQNITPKAAAEKLHLMYGDREICFVNPDFPYINANIPEHYIYARYAKESGLNIIDQALFDKANADNAGKAVFDNLQCFKKSPIFSMHKK